MPKPLRYYQRDAVDAVFDYWSTEGGHALVDMATGVGKSITMATLTKELVTGWPDMRVMNCVHVVELVEGNFMEMLGIWPTAPAGIIAASLDRRDYRAQLPFAQLQTVWDKVELVGHIDVLIPDETHLIPSDSNAMYRKLIDGLLRINPDLKIVGFSATPYRLDSGRLDEGEGRLFDKVVYTYGIRQGIDDGYLTPITSKPVGLKLDVTGVGKSMGDFKKGALQEAVDKSPINRVIAQEVLAVEGGRQKALFFCAGIDHATHMRDEIRALGRSCEVLTSKTPKAERRPLIAAYKRGDIWAICNDNIMSTGTNVPGIDLIVDCAPTASASRYAQRAGRGTRVIYPRGFDPEASDPDGRRAAIAAGIKPNCRYMDFAGNIQRHGPVDMIEPKRPGEGGGECPLKICPNCEELLHTSLRVCSCCGHEFPFDDTPKINTTADITPILSTDAAEWYPVNPGGQTFRVHEKAGKPPSIRVDYMVGMSVYKLFLGVELPKAKPHADRFWARHGGQRPFPMKSVEFLERAGELKATAELLLDLKEDFPIKDYRAGEGNEIVIEVPVPEDPERARTRASWAEMDSEIPF